MMVINLYDFSPINRKKLKIIRIIITLNHFPYDQLKLAQLISSFPIVKRCLKSLIGQEPTI